MDANELREVVSKYWWYHSIDLGNGIITPGHFGANLPAVMELLDQIEISGMTCLDVGTMDGKIAFEMEKRGANRVVTIDLAERETVYFLLEYFKSTIQYIPNVHINDIVSALEQRKLCPFDLIVLSGVLYHVYSPLDVILSMRRIVRHGGLILVESACVDSLDCSMHFNCDGRYYNEPLTFWLPSIGCLRYMLAFSCFEPLQEATLRGTGKTVRHAILAKAKKPSEMRNYSDRWLYDLHHAAPDWAKKFLMPLDLNNLERAGSFIDILVTDCMSANMLTVSRSESEWMEILRRIGLRHILHPIQFAKSLYRVIVHRIAERHFRSICRGQ
jgi:2-polyprenyl-3-methyl-5-hydroxy-6-metoxy-1,4-benzoquinol methylase